MRAVRGGCLGSRRRWRFTTRHGSQTVQDPFWEGKKGARRGGKERKGRRGDREKEDALEGRGSGKDSTCSLPEVGMIALALVDVTSELIGTLIVNSRADDNRAK